MLCIFIVKVLPLILVNVLVNPEMTKLNFHCEIWIKLFLFCCTFILEWCVCGPIRQGNCSSNLVSNDVTHQTGLAFAILRWWWFRSLSTCCHYFSSHIITNIFFFFMKFIFFPSSCNTTDEKGRETRKSKLLWYNAFGDFSWWGLKMAFFLYVCMYVYVWKRRPPFEVAIRLLGVAPQCVSSRLFSLPLFLIHTFSFIHSFFLLLFASVKSDLYRGLFNWKLWLWGQMEAVVTWQIIFLLGGDWEF